MAQKAQLPVTPADISLFEEDGVYLLRNDDGYALYTSDRDAPNQSNCNAQCAKLWPPVVPPADARPVGEWTIIKRGDSSRQWAFQGKPVYTYAKDPPGGTAGDGVGGVWRLLKF